MAKRNWLDSLSPRMLRILIPWWPPFIGTGLKVVKLSEDFLEIEVSMKLFWFNKNYVGTHFGGSMFAMTDPFFMLMLIKNLGGQYIVWDKSAAIEYIKPGRGRLRAHFKFTPEEILAIKENADREEKYIFEREVAVVNDDEELIARVSKTIYVRKKRPS